MLCTGPGSVFGGHSRNEPASRDCTTPLELRPQQHPGVWRNVLLSLLMTPDVGKEHSIGKGRGWCSLGFGEESRLRLRHRREASGNQSPEFALGE